MRLAHSWADEALVEIKAVTLNFCDRAVGAARVRITASLRSARELDSAWVLGASIARAVFAATVRTASSERHGAVAMRIGAAA